MKHIIVIISMLVVFPHSSLAITRDEAVRIALEKSEAVRIVEESSAELRAAGNQATAFVYPQLTFETGYFEMGNNAEESPIPYLNAPDRDISAGVTGTQVLYAGGRIWRSLDLKKNYQTQADLYEKSGKRDVAKAVRSAFDNYLYQKAALDININRLSQRHDELDDAKDLKDAGMVTSLDVRQANLNLNFAKAQLQAGEAALKEALIDFNLALGRSASDEFLVPEGKLGEVPDMTDIIKKLYANVNEDAFLDSASLKTQFDAADLNLKITGGEYLPEVALMASGKSNGEKAGDMTESWRIGVQLEWNFYDGGLVRAKKASAKAQMRQARENLAKTKKELSGAVDKININIQSLEKRIAIQKEAVELSKSNYEDARSQYRAGTITHTQLGEYNLSNAEARFNLIGLYYMQSELVTSALALLEN